jgi:hypothetical protein
VLEEGAELSLRTHDIVVGWRAGLCTIRERDTDIASSSLREVRLKISQQEEHAGSFVGRYV